MEDNKELKIKPEEDSKDINKNVGSFSNSVVPAITEPEKAPAVTKKVKADQQEESPEINFEKFSKTKKKRFKGSKTSFGVKVEGWLSNPKKLALIWGIIFLVIAVLYSFQIFYIVESHNLLKNINGGPLAFKSARDTLFAGMILSYISVILPTLPILFLITSWFIGINGVYYSRIFHYIFWSVLAFCLLLLIADSICCWIEFGDYWMFNAYIKPDSGGGDSGGDTGGQ